MTEAHPLVRYANASRAAYLSGDGLRLALADIGLELIDEHSSGESDTQCFAATDTDGAIVMGFRGTEDTSDMLRDAEILVSAMTCCRMSFTHLVHAGFLGAWADVCGWARHIWSTEHRPRLVLCGHSLGGAIATLAAADAFSDIETELYTYGSPRVGLSSFARDFPATGVKVTRVVHDDDIVPRVPGLPYEHVCEGLWLTTDGQVVTSRSFWQRLQGDLTAENFRDHHMDRYVDACRGYVQNQMAAKP